MNEKLLRRIMLRKKFCKRIVFAVLTLSVSVYISTLLFGDLRSPILIQLTDLDRCPACYGISICPELYSDQIIMKSGNPWSTLFNAKNVFYGYTKTNKPVVMKKLAHSWELKEFDMNLCGNWGLKNDCKPKHLLDISNIEDGIVKAVQYNISYPDYKPRKGLVMCPYAYSIYDLIQPTLKKTNAKSDMINVWTMLKINPEPLILQVLQKSKGWPVPAWGGVCGRLEVVSNDGIPLSLMMNIPWHRKLFIANKIINAALDFTFKHERFRFYLMDWSLDNIVVNEKDEISFVDLEDLIVLDKVISPGKDLPNWYQRYSKEDIGPGFIFSIEYICQHHLSDHNLWAACFVLAGDEMPFLYPIPEDVDRSRPYLQKLLYDCLTSEDRFHTVTKLQELMIDMLADENIVKVGVVR